MFGQEQLQELLTYDAGEQKVLSLYLDVDNSKEPIDAIKLRAKGLIKEAKLNQNQAVDIIERYLDHSFDWSKPGLAIFAGVEGDFFRAYPVAVSFRNRVRISKKPYVKPLTHLLDHYAYYGVILIDRVGARFFDYHLGELQSVDGVMGEDVRKLKLGGGSSTIGMRGGQGHNRHEDEVVQRNLRDAAKAASLFFTNKPIRRLFLGGTTETVAQFRDLLSKKLQSCLAGTFAIDMDAGEHEVRKQSLFLLLEANIVRERKLIEMMISTYRKGGAAVIGLDDSLQAISDKRVQTLIISDGYRTPGYVHELSGFVVANLAKSPLSESELAEVDDVVETAVAYTIAQGGHVEIVANEPALEDVGRIGAILRY